MGNCQAIDNATLVIQQPNGRVDKVYYSAVSASEIMKLNPGHYVAALLLTTTTSSNTNVPFLRVTRIKLLRPSDTLLLGHVYRLVTSQEVMKGLKAKKQRQQEKGYADAASKNVSDSEKTSSLVNQARQRSRRSNTKANSSTASKGFRTWQPSLNSISETAAAGT